MVSLKIISSSLLLLSIIIYVFGVYLVIDLINNIFVLGKIIESLSTINFEVGINQLQYRAMNNSCIEVLGEVSINITWRKPVREVYPVIIFIYDNVELVKIVLNYTTPEYSNDFNVLLYIKPEDLLDPDKYVSIYIGVDTRIGRFYLLKKILNASDILLLAKFLIEDISIYSVNEHYRFEFDIRTYYPVKIPITIELCDETSKVITSYSLDDFNTFNENPYHVIIDVYTDPSSIKYLCITIYGVRLVKIEI